MSAYAMPGLLPPFESCYSKTQQLSEATSDSSLSSSEGSKSPSSVREIIRVPEYSYACDIIWSLPPKEEKKEVEIIVRDSRIDAVKLVQGIVSSSAPSSCTSGMMSGGAIGASAGSGRSSRWIRRSRRRSGRTASMADSGSSSQRLQDEVMLFDLDIIFRGETRSVTRSLSSIKQLRKDLIREVEDKVKLDMMFADDVMRQSICESHRDMALPELSPVPDSSASGPSGPSCGPGFALLSDVVRSYAPKVQRWFNDVAKIVLMSKRNNNNNNNKSFGECPADSSPYFECHSAVLSHFLWWEPASMPPNVKLLEEELAKRMPSLERLDSIEESHFE